MTLTSDAKKAETKAVLYFHDVTSDAENFRRHKKLCIHMSCLCIGTVITSMLSTEAMLVFASTGLFQTIQEILDFITHA